MRTNRERLVKISVLGEVAPARLRSPYHVDREGKVLVMPGLGGIVYNVRVGDKAYGWEGDHVEPGASLSARNKDEEVAFMTLSCIGNEAVVVSGDAKGKKGVVTGKHGGVNHVIVHFDEDTLNTLSVGDKVLIKAWGQGLKLLDYPQVKVMNIDPSLFEKLDIVEKDGKIFVPVVAKIDARYMGSGVGALSSASTDYDIMVDPETVGLQGLRLGDLVAIVGHDNTYGVGEYREGAVSIGVVVHAACVGAGHGPGVVVIMSSKEAIIVPEIVESYNIAEILGLR